jgi:uncharacterized protein
MDPVFSLQMDWFHPTDIKQLLRRLPQESCPKKLDMKQPIEEFLALERIAVAGVSRNGDVPANAIYRKLRSSGYRVFALNPNTDRVEDDPCFPDLGSLPEKAQGLMIATHPDQADGLIRQCCENGVTHVWFHRSIGQGSFNEQAAAKARESGITVIDGGCPMMYCQPVDIFHKCLRWAAGYPKLHK